MGRREGRGYVDEREREKGTMQAFYKEKIKVWGWEGKDCFCREMLEELKEGSIDEKLNVFW